MSTYNFESQKHLYYWCRKMLKKKKCFDKEISELIKMATCDLYQFKILYEDIIETKYLRCPLNVFTYQLYKSDSKENVKKTINSGRYIIEDYQKCMKMSVEEIEDSQYSEYLEMKAGFRERGYYDRNKQEHKVVRDEILESMNKLMNKTGVYKLYDINRKLIYIGKSHNLGKRILSSAEERRAEYYSYSVTENKADTNIYELYLIAKHKPIKNGKDNVNDIPSIKLPKLKFSDMKKLYREEGTKKFMEVG